MNSKIKIKMFNLNEICPCNSTKSYKECCFPLHNRVKNARTAEELMRSRYSAYVLKDEDYLKRTWHRSKRPVSLALKDENITWLSLTILNKKDGKLEDNTGIVEFIAKYTISNKEHKLHEISNFIKVEKKWFYVDGKTI